MRETKMNFSEPISIGLSQLRANKLRSVLSLVGILIAVGAVTGIVSIGDGLRNSIMGEFDKIGGVSTIWSWAPSQWYRDSQGRWIRRNWEEYLTQEDVRAIMAETDKVEMIIPNVWVGGEGWDVRYRSVSEQGRITCTVPEFLLDENWKVFKGRFLSVLDLLNKEKVCVIGNQVAKDLFGPDVDPLNKEIKIGSTRFTVVGVMEPKEFFDNDYNNRTMIPLTTAQSRIIGNDHLGWIAVKVKNPKDVKEVTEAMRRVYKRLHEHGEDFGLQTGETALAEIDKVIGIMKIIAGGIAGISLLVGGIGIMNIMLVSVTERTREVGMRKAVGATRGDILRQFLVEAIVLCLFGGALGVLLGMGLGSGLSIYIKSVSHNSAFASVISPKMAMLAVGFSLGVGVVFGVYPAWRASRLSPVEALRSE
jgi:putative ABC transport system permease protein